MNGKQKEEVRFEDKIKEQQLKNLQAYWHLLKRQPQRYKIGEKGKWQGLRNSVKNGGEI